MAGRCLQLDIISTLSVDAYLFGAMRQQVLLRTGYQRQRPQPSSRQIYKYAVSTATKKAASMGTATTAPHIHMIANNHILEHFIISTS